MAGNTWLSLEFLRAGCGAGERERAANERAQAATSRQASLLAALDAVREEASEARRQADEAQCALLDAQQRSKRLEEQLQKVFCRLKPLSFAYAPSILSHSCKWGCSHRWAAW